MECGREAFKVTENGLSYQQWLFCIGYSAITFVLCVILKLIPIDKKIQDILDNIDKRIKVGNIDDLEANASGSKDKFVEKNNSVISKNNESAEKKIEKRESRSGLSRSGIRKVSIDVNFTKNNNN